MTVTKRTWIAGGVALVVLGLLVRGCGHVWAGGELRAYREAHAGDVEKLRTEVAALRPPALEGTTPSDAECFAAYDRAFKDLQHVAFTQPDYMSMDSLVQQGPRSVAAKLTPELKEKIAASAPAFDEIVEATRCSRLDPARVVPPAPYQLHLQTLGSVLVLRGHERVIVGDDAGAMKDYTRAVKIAGDLALFDGVPATLLAQAGCMAVAGEAASGQASPAAIDYATRALPPLEAWLPRFVNELRIRKLLLSDMAGDALAGVPIPSLSAPMFDMVRGTQRVAATAMTLVFTDRALVALAIPELEPYYDDALRLAGQPTTTRDEEKRLEDALLAKLQGSSNPAVIPSLPLDAPQQIRFRSTMRAACALADTALRLEGVAAANAGTFPSAADAAIPVDPADGSAPLRYEPAAGGKGYRLASVGRDRDEASDDLVVEHAAGP